MELHGTVRAVEPFGVVVDVGLGHGGLVHISEFKGRGVPKPVPNVGDEVTAWVRDFDADKHRISLTMVPPPKYKLADLKPDMMLTGKVVRVTKFGAFVDVGADKEGLVHVSEMAEGFVRNPADVASVGSEVPVRVLGVDLEKGQIRLSMKQAVPPPLEEPRAEAQVEMPAATEYEPTAFELALLEARNKTAVRQQQKRQRRERVRPEHDEDDIFARTIRYHHSQAKK
jgi:transcriptional accessory protein Tex/SPT6